jgi:hypothetical protein
MRIRMTAEREVYERCARRCENRKVMSELTGIPQRTLDNIHSGRMVVGPLTMERLLKFERENPGSTIFHANKGLCKCCGKTLAGRAPTARYCSQLCSRREEFIRKKETNLGKRVCSGNLA